jgi:hypothetical protein
MKCLFTAVSFFSLLAFAPRIDAHGASVEVDRTIATAGQEITIRGEDITENGEVLLTLQGLRGDYSLGRVRGDDRGGFETTVTLPSGLSAGEYTLIASGDETATVNLTLQEPVANDGHGQPADHAEHGDPAHVHAASPHANPQPMVIERSTGVSHTLAWGLTLVSGLLGVSLLFRERRR